MKISVIIPYKEDRGYLNQAINSFHKQDYEDKELILSQSDNKVGYNLNKGIMQSKGDLITYLCDDDLLPANALTEYAAFYNENDFDFVHGNAVNFIAQDNVYTGFLHQPMLQHPKLRNMLRANSIHGGTVCYHRSVFDKYGLFDETLWTGEEYDFNMMIMAEGAKLGYLDKLLYYYRRHDEQKSQGVREYQNKRVEAIKLIKNRYENNS